MKFSPSKAASASLPAVTVAAPIGAVVVLTVNETPVEQIKLLDSTKQKLKTLESGLNMNNLNKPTLKEQELTPTPPPSLNH